MKQIILFYFLQFVYLRGHYKCFFPTFHPTFVCKLDFVSELIPLDLKILLFKL